MDNQTFLENLGRYLLYQVAIKIYHQSSIYFYKYQLNKDFLHLLPFYYAYHLEHYGGFDKGALVYRNIEYIGDGYGIDKTILVDNSILNDFVKFKLKKNINSWSIHAYRKEDLAADTIKSAWKKNKWNYLKNLAAWKYHPSRLTFEID